MNKPMDEQKTTHRKTFWIASGVFVFIAVIAVAYWSIWARYQESTNDAYVNGNMIRLNAQVAGVITRILTDNTQLVEEGQPLIELDRSNHELILEQAKAHLAQMVRQVHGLFIQVEQLEAKKQVYESDLTQAQLDYQHRKALVVDGSVSTEDFEHSQTTLFSAYAKLKCVNKELEQAISQISNTTIETHPLVEDAKAKLRESFLALHRCTIKSPARAIVTLRTAQVGQRVEASTPLLSLVPLDQLWVDANFREVSLKNLRIGQDVHLVSDMYGHQKTFHGTIVGLNPGTGSMFSLLPPQNATGNWIKIVQRVPVKIALDQGELLKNPLLLGLSMTAKVYTHSPIGAQLPSQAIHQTIYNTNIFDDELEGVTEIIDQLIQASLDGK